ncbi:MAG: HEPN domain-containing protein [Planctomycetota bacterium]
MNCQQAVEKLLKAYLVFREHEFEKIHDLEVLAEQCALYDQGFDAWRERVDPLTLFAVRFRYPSPSEPSAEQVQDAMGVVHEVWDFVVNRLPPDARP